MSYEMASPAGIDPAIALAARLRRECRANVVRVTNLPQGITIDLAIPRSGLLRVASQREAIGRSGAMTERNRSLVERA